MFLRSGTAGTRTPHGSGLIFLMAVVSASSLPSRVRALSFYNPLCRCSLQTDNVAYMDTPFNRHAKGLYW